MSVLYSPPTRAEHHANIIQAQVEFKSAYTDCNVNFNVLFPKELNNYSTNFCRYLFNKHSAVQQQRWNKLWEQRKNLQRKHCESQWKKKISWCFMLTVGTVAEMVAHFPPLEELACFKKVPQTMCSPFGYFCFVTLRPFLLIHLKPTVISAIIGLEYDKSTSKEVIDLKKTQFQRTVFFLFPLTLCWSLPKCLNWSISSSLFAGSFFVKIAVNF